MLPVFALAQQVTAQYPVTVKLFKQEGGQPYTQVGGVLSQISSSGAINYGLRARFSYCQTYPSSQFVNQITAQESCESLDISTNQIQVQITRVNPQVTRSTTGIYTVATAFGNPQYLTISDTSKPIYLTNQRGERTGEYLIIEKW